MANLRGNVSLKVILDRASVKKAQDDFADALDQAVPKAVGDLVRRGAQHLRDLDQALGHDSLAALWTHTRVKTNAGTAEATVFSEAEGMKFYRDTTDAASNRVRSKKSSHLVDGDMLMSFLEGGTPPHEIDATREATGDALFFPIAYGVKESDFAGTAQTEDGTVAGFFQGPGADGFFEGQSVDHPGFAGNHNVLNTFLLMDRGVEQFMNEAGDWIVKHFDQL